MSSRVSEIIPPGALGGLYLCGTGPLKKRNVSDVEHGDMIGAVVSCMPSPPIREMALLKCVPHLKLSLNKDKPWPDDTVPLRDALTFIHGHRAQGRGVVVHCSQGKHRSASVVCAYLVFAGISPDLAAAESYVKARRSLIRPSDQARPLWDSISALLASIRPWGIAGG